MAANVALTDTFDTWRTRTNVLLEYTGDNPATNGGTEEWHIANTSDSSSTSTGALIVKGGVGIAKKVYIGDDTAVGKNVSITQAITVSGNASLGDATTDEIAINGSITTNLAASANGTLNIGNTTHRYAQVFVHGVVGANTISSLQIPVGTTAQQAGETGAIRYNSELSRLEANNGTAFASVGADPQDADADTKITMENSSDEDIIRFFTSSNGTATERMIITGDDSQVGGGNVAIGISADNEADAMFKVKGTANVTGTVTLTNVVLNQGNTTFSGEFANVATSDHFKVVTPTTTIDSPNTIITGNLVVQGTQTYIDTTNQVSKDKTIILGAGSNVFSQSAFTAADPTEITSKRNGTVTAHGLSVSDKIMIVRTDDNTNIPKDTIFTVASAPTSTTFTIDLTGAPSGVGTLDFIKVADSIIDEGGLMLPGDTIHSILWDDTNDKWKFTDDIQIGGNKILASDGTTSMTMIDSSGDVTFNGDITVGGDNIKSSTGTPITLSGTSVTVAGTLTAGGNVTSYEDANGADVTLALGTSAAESLVVEVKNDSSAKTLDEVNFISKAASTSADKGKFNFKVDETTRLTVDDGGIDVVGAMAATGAVSGTTGTFSSDVSGVAGSFSGAVSGTTGTFSGAVSGTTGTFSGLVSCNGGLTVQDGDTFTFDDTAFTTAAQFRIRNAADNANLFDGYVLKA